MGELRRFTVHGLLAALGLPTNDQRSIVCRKSAVVQQLEILRKTYEDTASVEDGVFHLTLDLEPGKVTVTIEGFETVHDRLPYEVQPGTEEYDRTMREAFGG